MEGDSQPGFVPVLPPDSEAHPGHVHVQELEGDNQPGLVPVLPPDSEAHPGHIRLADLHRSQFGTLTVTVVHSDICLERVDAITNAANSNLAHSGGVAAAIVRAGGKEIQTESTQYVRSNG